MLNFLLDDKLLFFQCQKLFYLSGSYNLLQQYCPFSCCHEVFYLTGPSFYHSCQRKRFQLKCTIIEIIGNL